MREGHGTTGGRAPEAMLHRKVPCHASQDVYALAHLMLMTFTKPEWKRDNMWVSKVGAGGATGGGDAPVAVSFAVAVAVDVPAIVFLPLCTFVPTWSIAQSYYLYRRISFISTPPVLGTLITVPFAHITRIDPRVPLDPPLNFSDSLGFSTLPSATNLSFLKAVLTTEDIRTCDHKTTREDQQAFVVSFNDYGGFDNICDPLSPVNYTAYSQG